MSGYQSWHWVRLTGGLAGRPQGWPRAIAAGTDGGGPMDEVRQLDTGSEASTRPRPHSPQDSARDLELSPPGRRFAPKDGWRSVARFLIAVGVSALICSLLGRFAAPSLTGPIDIVGYPTFANFNLWPQFWEYRLLVYGLPFFAIVGYVLLARFGPLRSRSPRPAKRTIELVEPAPTAPPTPDGALWGTLARILLPAAVVVTACGARTGHIDLLAVAAGVAYVALVAVAAEVWA